MSDVAVFFHSYHIHSWATGSWPRGLRMKVGRLSGKGNSSCYRAIVLIRGSFGAAVTSTATATATAVGGAPHPPPRSAPRWPPVRRPCCQQVPHTRHCTRHHPRRRDRRRHQFPPRRGASPSSSPARRRRQPCCAGWGWRQRPRAAGPSPWPRRRRPAAWHGGGHHVAALSRGCVRRTQLPLLKQQHNHPHHSPCYTLSHPSYHPRHLRNTKSPSTTPSDTPITRGTRTGARHPTRRRRPHTVRVQRRRLRRHIGRRPLPSTKHTVSRQSPLHGRRPTDRHRHQARCPCRTCFPAPTGRHRHQARGPCPTSRHRHPARRQYPTSDRRCHNATGRHRPSWCHNPTGRHRPNWGSHPNFLRRPISATVRRLSTVGTHGPGRSPRRDHRERLRHPLPKLHQIRPSACLCACRGLHASSQAVGHARVRRDQAGQMVYGTLEPHDLAIHSLDSRSNGTKERFQVGPLCVGGW